jgi:D-erythrulose 1-phosphate 3-epimerase
MSPRMHLALDNCFASKRWTDPLEWMQIARDCDIYHIEASADNECDPLYSTPEALRDWVERAQQASAATGVQVSNLYSGHGTYATLGLAHTDMRVRDRIQHDWLEPMIETAASLGAGLGFFCHAFSQATLQHPTQYAEAYTDLIRRLGEIASFAQAKGVMVSVEQMYTPHQIPWTVAGGAAMLREIAESAPMYLTLDTGHQVGQQHYLKPTADQFDDAGRWRGYVESTDPQMIADYLDAHDYLFAAPEDGDLYHWLRTLGCYSPIIHLQQTDGHASAHRPFTPNYNATGIVEPRAVLEAIAESYAQPVPAGMPPRCEDIYLTLEIFSSTMEQPRKILENIQQSAAYWRTYIPQDGLPLDTLLHQMKN